MYFVLVFFDMCHQIPIRLATLLTREPEIASQEVALPILSILAWNRPVHEINFNRLATHSIELRSANIWRKRFVISLTRGRYT